MASLDPMATYYEVLRIEPSASHEEIAKAYFRQSSGSRTGGFLRGAKQGRSERARVEEAYAVLIDRTKRAEYDRQLGAGNG